MDVNVPQAQPAHRMSKFRQELQELTTRVSNLENQVLQANQGLQDLLVHLESAIVSAGELWNQKVLVLKWMIITMGLIVMDRLLSNFPQIMALVEKFS